MKPFLDIKKFLLLILGVVLLFVPTYAAIFSYFANKQEPPNLESSTTLTVKDPDGRVTTATGDDDPNEYIPLFSKIIANSAAVSSLPDSIAGESFMLVTFADGEEQKAYKFYFSTEVTACYFSDPTGAAYRIATAEVRAFLGTSLSLYLYHAAQPPVLTLADGAVIAPERIEWHYLTAGNTFQEYTDKSASPAQVSYDVGSDAGMRFSIEPSECNLTVYNGTDLLFDGAYGNMPGLDLKRNSTLTFKLEAAWYKGTDAQYYGTAVYTFIAEVTAPAEFRLGENVIYHGDVAVISGVNVSDPSKITFESTPSLGFTPVFYADGEYVHTLIPVSYGLDKGEYTFTVGYGLVSQKLTLRVEDYQYGYKNSSLDVSANLIATCYTEQDIADYTALYAQICEKSETMLYSTGAFMNYENPNTLTAAKSTLMLGFARNVSLKNAPGRTFEHTGVDFKAAAGIDVPAMNAGKVVYAGSCDVLGTFVVVDHGYGLKSWYAHLGEATVSVGDTVRSGQSVGKSGATGFIPAGRVHVGFTVYDVPVAPYSLWSEGIVFPSFN